MRNVGRGEQEHIADLSRAGEQHQEPIHSERYASRFGHRVERREETFVEREHFAAEARALALLGLEARALLARVGQLGEPIRKLQTSGVQLEPLGNARIRGDEPGERSLRSGILRQVRRSGKSEGRFHAFQKHLCEQVIPRRRR